MENPELTILVPTYKEEKRIGATLEELGKYLKENNLAETTEVLIFDSASPDKTEEVSKSKADLFKNFRFEKAADHPGPVKGRDVKAGIMHAKGKYILFMDADLATPLSHVKEFLDKARSGANVVIGVRDVTKHHKGILRKIISWGGNVLVQIVLLPGIKDTQTGFKLFEKELAHKVFDKVTITGWTFDMEALAIARKIFKEKIHTVELPDWQDIAGGTFAPSASVAIGSIIDLFKIRFNLWLGKYT